MFRPSYNSGQDLEAYRKMRERALNYNPELGDIGPDAPAPRPGPYNPEYGDTGTDAPVAVPGPYNPELGDTGMDAPAAAESTDAAIDRAYLEHPEDFATEKPTYNPEEGDVDLTAPPAVLGKQDVQEQAGMWLRPAPKPEVPTPALSPYSASYSGEPGPMAAPMPPAPGHPAPAPGRPMAGPAPSAVARAVQPGQTRQQARPVSAAYDAGPEPTSEVWSVLKGLPALIGGYAMTKSMSGHRAEPGKMQAMDEMFARSREQAATDDQARINYAKRKQYLARLQSKDEAERSRQAKLDARQQVLEGREDEKYELSKEARDPASQKNALFRKAVEKTYPELWSSLSPEQQAGLTIENAQGMSPAMQDETGRRQAAAEASAKEKARLQGIQDRQDYFKFRQSNKRPTVNVGLRLGGPDAKANTIKALGEMYGGEDKVPAGVRQQVELSKNSDALRSVIAQATDDLRQDKGQGMQASKSNFQERKEYAKVTKDLHVAEGSFKRSDETFKSLGIDMDKWDGGDIPGHGRLETYLPNLLQGEKGQQVRQRIRQHVADMARQMSGLAMTEGERNEYREIAGAAPGMSDSALVRGYKELKDRHRDLDRQYKVLFKDVEAEYRQRLEELDRPQGGVRIISPNSGKPATFKGTREEALKRGYKLVE